MILRSGSEPSQAKQKSSFRSIFRRYFSIEADGFGRRYSEVLIEVDGFGRRRRGWPAAGGGWHSDGQPRDVEFKGKSLVVTKSSQSSTGYKNVIKLRTDELGPIYVAKFKVEGESGQRNCPKSYSRSPQEAAAALAYFEAGYLGAMPTKKDYAVRRTAQVRGCPHPLCAVCILSPRACCVCHRKWRRRKRSELE